MNNLITTDIKILAAAEKRGQIENKDLLNIPCLEEFLYLSKKINRIVKVESFTRAFFNGKDFTNVRIFKIDGKEFQKLSGLVSYLG